MYNSIYPININYSNHKKYKGSVDNQNTNENGAKKETSYAFPNGTKPAIDYHAGQINISQVVCDFKNTIVAINTPEDIAEDVNIYLSLVEKESLKENPSRDIIISNLKNASKICDKYISDSLKKPSKVVEGWIDALFLQKINLKSDPNEINPDFLLEFPKKTKNEPKTAEIPASPAPTTTVPKEPATVENTFLSVTNPVDNKEKITVDTEENKDLDELFTIESEEEPDSTEVISNIENNIDESEIIPDIKDDKTSNQNQSKGLFDAESETDVLVKELFLQAKNEPKNNFGDTNKLNLLNEALGIISKSDDFNRNIKAAIHFERGKVFDEYDYVDYALRDYYEATSTLDNNLKAQAYFKSGKIYDEFREFNPALENYLSCVAYSGQAENFNAQSMALSSIAGLYASQYDLDKTNEFNNLALDTVSNTDNTSLIAKTYSNAAENYRQAGDNKRALDSYKNALQVFVRDDESYEQIAYNYKQASKVMRELGNIAKAKKLQEKSDLYYQKAQQQKEQLEEAS